MIFDSKRDTEYEIGLFLFEMYHRDWEKNHTEVKGGIWLLKKIKDGILDKGEVYKG